MPRNPLSVPTTSDEPKRRQSSLLTFFGYLTVRQAVVVDDELYRAPAVVVFLSAVMVSAAGASLGSLFGRPGAGVAAGIVVAVVCWFGLPILSRFIVRHLLPVRESFTVYSGDSLDNGTYTTHWSDGTATRFKARVAQAFGSPESSPPGGDAEESGDEQGWTVSDQLARSPTANGAGPPGVGLAASQLDAARE